MNILDINQEHSNGECSAAEKKQHGSAILRRLLNKSLKIVMSDGRVLIGIFLCTDGDANIILGSCSEYLPQEIITIRGKEEPRMLGLVMVPGKHIVAVFRDVDESVLDLTNNVSLDYDDEDII